MGRRHTNRRMTAVRCALASSIVAVLFATTTALPAYADPPVGVEAAAAPATPVVDPSNGVVITGTAQPGVTIVVLDESLAPLGQTSADGAGNWAYTPAAPLADRAVIYVRAEDGSGGVSGTMSIVIDAVAPDAPGIEPTDGTLITGTGEPGIRVILTTRQGDPIGQTLVDGSGRWTFLPSPPLPHGVEILVVARDPASNTSSSASMTVDAVAPDAPTISLLTPTQIRGSAEPGATVQLVRDGTPAGVTTADGGGVWSYFPTEPFPVGATITVTAVDAAGNSSPSASGRVIDSSVPPPTVRPTNGTTLTGTARPGDRIQLVFQSTTLITFADAAGEWTAWLRPHLDNGTPIWVTAHDIATGAVSSAVTILVDAVAPARPVLASAVHPTLSGSAEPGSTVRVYQMMFGFPDSLVTTVAADAAGAWTAQLAGRWRNGALLRVTATDAAGNTSEPSAALFLTVIPAVPVIDPSDGRLISGTADPDTSVILRDGQGQELARPYTASEGRWWVSFGTPRPDGEVVSAVAFRDGQYSEAATMRISWAVPPTPIIRPTDGRSLSGTAEPGVQLILTVDGSAAAEPCATLRAAADGTWSCVPAARLPHGAVLRAVARYATGTTSGEAVATVDAVAPAAPVIRPTDGRTVAGSAEPGARIDVWSADGLRADTVADAGGAWSLTLQRVLDIGTIVSATATDAAGNASGRTDIAVVRPAPPQVEQANRWVITGTGVPGTYIYVRVEATGAELGIAVVNEQGAWAFSRPEPWRDGEVIRLVAATPDGVMAEPLLITIDAIPPADPTLRPSNGSAVSGTGEPGSRVRVVADVTGTGDPNNGGRLLCDVAPDAAGEWSCPVAPRLAHGAKVFAIAFDDVGNPSGIVEETVDAEAPETPALAPTDGTVLSGTAESGAEVVARDGDAAMLGATIAAPDGSWRIVPAAPVPVGGRILVTATDAVGNVSAALDARAEAPELTVEVSAAPDSFSRIGDEIVWTVAVVNSGRLAVTGLSAAFGDPSFARLLGAAVDVCDAADLAPGDRATCVLTTTADAADVVAGTGLTRTITVSARSVGGVASAPAAVRGTVPYVAPPVVLPPVVVPPAPMSPSPAPGSALAVTGADAGGLPVGGILLLGAGLLLVALRRRAVRR